MKDVTLPVAYMPLVDAAPLIIAKELGLAQAERLSLDLIAAPSWSSLRDMLAFGRVDAAHMLSPVPLAMAMGFGGGATEISAVSVMSHNGNVIGAGDPISKRMRANGFGFDFADPVKAADAMAEASDGPIVFGVPFPFSMHVELLRYWSANSALKTRGIEIRTVPPPLMADALAAGEIDAFCVGEPWGSVAVENGVASLLLPGRAIWLGAPEKVLATRSNWAETEPDILGRLMRAVSQACKWLADPKSITTASAILSRKEYLDVPPEVIDRALLGEFTVSGRGEQRRVQNFMSFLSQNEMEPRHHHARWLADSLGAAYGKTELAKTLDLARVFRRDLFLGEFGPAQSPSTEPHMRGLILEKRGDGLPTMPSDPPFAHPVAGQKTDRDPQE